MAAIASAPALPGGRIDSRWIVGRGVDLSLVIGSAAAGYLYLLLFAALHAPMPWMWWIWSVGFDGTHIFATASRTYFDRDARARDRRLLFGSALVFFSARSADGARRARRAGSTCWSGCGPTITSSGSTTGSWSCTRSRTATCGRSTTRSTACSSASRPSCRRSTASSSTIPRNSECRSRFRRSEIAGVDPARGDMPGLGRAAMAAMARGRSGQRAEIAAARRRWSRCTG